MVAVHAVVMEQHARFREPGHLQRDFGVGAGHVVVVVVPHHDGHAAFPAAGERADVGRSAHSRLGDLIQGDRAGAHGLHPLPAHQPEHAEHVQHRLLDAVGGQRAEAVEPRLVFELEGPGDGAEEVHAVTPRQVVLPGEGRRRVAGVERPVAVSVLRIDAGRAGGASLGVGFANDDGLAAQLRKRRDDFEAAVDVGELGGDAHADVALDDLRPALGVEADEVERRAGGAGGVVLPVHRVLQEGAQELRRLLAARTGGVRAADAGHGQRPLDRIGRVVVELEVLLRRALPVADVGLVPDLPQPALDLGAPVALDRVTHPLVDQLSPFAVILRRVRPAGPDRRARLVEAEAVLVWLRLDGERLGHEADLDQRLHAALDVAVEDAVKDGPVEARAAGGVFGVGVGRSPLQSRRAVAGDQEIVGPHVDRHGTQLGELRQELAAVLHVGVVRLVVAEEGVHGPQLAPGLPRVNADGNLRRQRAAGEQRKADKPARHTRASRTMAVAMDSGGSSSFTVWPAALAGWSRGTSRSGLSKVL